MTARHYFNTCRFCGESEIGRNGTSDKLVKYGTRHYAHHACYLDAGKTLDDLHAWQVGQFPYRLLQKHGLIDKADRIIAADVQSRVDKLGEQGRRP